MNNPGLDEAGKLTSLTFGINRAEDAVTPVDRTFG
jgi:hypothetical protein